MHITHEATVILPVSDQERSRRFYVETLGFEQRVDFEYADGVRWVEVAPPGAALGIALVTADGAGIETRVAWGTSDIDGDHTSLRAQGVDVTDILREGDAPVQWAGATLAGTPPMFLLRDPDGNSFLVTYRSAP